MQNRRAAEKKGGKMARKVGCWRKKKCIKSCRIWCNRREIEERGNWRKSKRQPEKERKTWRTIKNKTKEVEPWQDACQKEIETMRIETGGRRQEYILYYGANHNSRNLNSIVCKIDFQLQFMSIILRQNFKRNFEEDDRNFFWDKTRIL